MKLWCCWHIWLCSNPSAAAFQQLHTHPNPANNYTIALPTMNSQYPDQYCNCSAKSGIFLDMRFEGVAKGILARALSNITSFRLHSSDSKMVTRTLDSEWPTPLQLSTVSWWRPIYDCLDVLWVSCQSHLRLLLSRCCWELGSDYMCCASNWRWTALSSRTRLS